MELKIDAKEYNVPDEIALNISNQFKPMLDKMVDLENEFNEVIKLPIESPETQIKAKELRLKYVKVRTATKEIHQQQKAFYLNGGRFVDGWKNAQLFASQGKEERLEAIEKYLENIEKKKIDDLQISRAEMLNAYVEDLTSIRTELGYMDEDVFQAYLSAKKKSYEEKQEANRKAAEEQEKINRINELNHSRKESLIEFWQFMDEDEKSSNYGIMSDKYFQGFLGSIRVRKDVFEEQQRKDKEERERLKAELAEKKLKEEERIQEEERKKKEAEKLQKAPIKKQLNAWVDTFELPPFSTKNELADEILKKFQSFKEWSKKQIKEI